MLMYTLIIIDSPAVPKTCDVINYFTDALIFDTDTLISYHSLVKTSFSSLFILKGSF